jgi:hypothetical protein
MRDASPGAGGLLDSRFSILQIPISRFFRRGILRLVSKSVWTILTMGLITMLALSMGMMYSAPASSRKFRRGLGEARHGGDRIEFKFENVTVR